MDITFKDGEVIIPIQKGVLVMTRAQFIDALKRSKQWRRQAALKARITPQESQGGEHREQT